MLRTNWTAQAVDDVLAGTFPASDPPAWTPGMARPAPEIAMPSAVTRTPAGETNDARAPAVIDTAVIDVSRPANSERTFARALMSLIGALGVALLFPLAIIAVGAPVALVVRGLLEAAEWLLTIMR